MAAVVVAPLDVVASWCQSAGAAFPILADPEHVVSEAYGVYNVLGDNLAAPAVFVVAADGRIVWSRIGQYSSDYVETQAILAALP